MLFIRVPGDIGNQSDNLNIFRHFFRPACELRHLIDTGTAESTPDVQYGKVFLRKNVVTDILFIQILRRKLQFYSGVLICRGIRLLTLLLSGLFRFFPCAFLCARTLFPGNRPHTASCGLTRLFLSASAKQGKSQNRSC